MDTLYPSETLFLIIFLIYIHDLLHDQWYIIAALSYKYDRN
jgi:hypothetical protein